jgi:hypothetical protein
MSKRKARGAETTYVGQILGTRCVCSEGGCPGCGVGRGCTRQDRIRTRIRSLGRGGPNFEDMLENISLDFPADHDYFWSSRWTDVGCCDPGRCPRPPMTLAQLGFEPPPPPPPQEDLFYPEGHDYNFAQGDILEQQMRDAPDVYDDEDPEGEEIDYNFGKYRRHSRRRRSKKRT